VSIAIIAVAIGLTLVVNKTKAVKLHEMDLSSGAREFDDIEDESEEEARYKEMTIKEKVVFQLKNW